MATDYRNQVHAHSHAPDYITHTGSSNGWLLALAAAALLGLLAFFLWTGGDRPVISTSTPAGTTSTQVTPQPAPAAPAQQSPAQ